MVEIGKKYKVFTKKDNKYYGQGTVNDSWADSDYGQTVQMMPFTFADGEKAPYGVELVENDYKFTKIASGGSYTRKTNRRNRKNTRKNARRYRK